MRIDRESLICDFAETYHISDFSALPARTAAILARGLRQDSRIMMKLSGRELSIQDFLLADMRDRVAWLQWSKTKDAAKNRNHPRSVLELLTKRKETDIRSFATVQEFESVRRTITGG